MNGNISILKSVGRLCALATLTLASFIVCEAAPKVPADPLPSVEVAASEVPELTTRAEAGDAKAQIRLGHYLMMHHEPGYANEKKAGEWFLKAAESGDAEGQAWYGIYVAIMGNKSSGPAVDYGLRWCLKSAEQGNPIGQYMAGLLTDNSSQEQKIAWYQKAAKQGFAPAQRAYGMYVGASYGSSNVKTSPAEAKRILQKAVAAGDGEACLGLAKLVQKDKGGAKKAEKLMKTAIDRFAERQWQWYDTTFDFHVFCGRYGHGGARYFLSMRAYSQLAMYYNSQGKENLYKKIRDALPVFMKKCAATGDTAAWYALGSLFRTYKALWFYLESQSPEDCKTYYRKAIETAAPDDLHAQRFKREAQKKINW